MEQKYNLNDDEKNDTGKETSREKIENARKVFLQTIGRLAILTIIGIGGPIFWIY